MALRDVLLATFVFGSLPVCFVRPWVGILVWTWLGMMNPHRLSWGFAYSIPFAQLVAIATIAGLLLNGNRERLPRTLETYLLLALWGWFFVTTLFAQYPEDAWGAFNKVSKILFMTFITLVLFQDRKKLHIFIWVIALSIGFYGFKGGIWAVLTGGQYQVLGPENSFIEGNTEIGLALNMVLPLFLFLRREETRPWLRHLLLALFGFSIIAVLITYSRGAFLGLGVVLFVLSLKTRFKLIATVFLLIAVLLAPSVLPEKWFGRMETIKTYEQDESAMSRLTAWGVAYNLALDRPLFGGGFRTFTVETWERYVPGWGRDTDAHSIYFQVLGEHGFVGLAIFMGLCISTMLTLRRLKRRCRRDPNVTRVYNCVQMLEVSFLGYFISGAFLSLSYFDLFYNLLAVVIILKKVVLSQEQMPVSAQSISVERAGTEIQVPATAALR